MRNHALRFQLTVLAMMLGSPVLAPDARAQTPGTAQCNADLARAEALIDRVAARDRAGPIADHARLCRTLRLNRSEMATAAALMNRCMTGHARGENLGQVVASIADVDSVIARRCQ